MNGHGRRLNLFLSIMIGVAASHHAVLWYSQKGLRPTGVLFGPLSPGERTWLREHAILMTPFGPGEDPGDREFEGYLMRALGNSLIWGLGAGFAVAVSCGVRKQNKRLNRTRDRTG
jgi:hypothetical protein